MARRRVVILGAGAAGVLAARALERLTDDCELTLVTRHPWARLTANLPSIAAGNADPRLASAPLRPLLRGARLVVAEILGVDAVSRAVQIEGAEVRAGLASPSLPYDDLIVALGASPARREGALPFASAADAAALRERLAAALAAASAEESPRKRKILASVAVLGDNAAACALAGELLFALRKAAACWPRLEPAEPRVLLISAGELLPSAPRALASAVRRSLEQLGVEVRTGAVVARVADDHLMLAGTPDERVEVRTVVSTASPEAPACLGPLRADGRLVPVAATHLSATFAGLWAIGACADLQGSEAAPVALDDLAAQARRLARNVQARASSAALDASPPRPPLRAFSIAPGRAAGSLGPAPLPPSLLWSIHTYRQLALYHPGATLAEVISALAPGAFAGLTGQTGAAPPALYLTPPPATALALPASASTLPLDGPTAPGLPPFTLPAPTPPPRR